MKNLFLKFLIGFWGLSIITCTLTFFGYFLSLFGMNTQFIEMIASIGSLPLTLTFIPVFMVVLIMDNYRWKTRSLIFLTVPISIILYTELHNYGLQDSEGVAVIISGLRLDASTASAKVALSLKCIFDLLLIGIYTFFIMTLRKELKGEVQVNKSSTPVLLARIMLALIIPWSSMFFSSVYFIKFLPEGVSLITKGFLRFENLGLISVEKRYEKEGKEVWLMPMAHIGVDSFYKQILDSLPNKKSALVLEGVKDEKKLVKLNHGKLAKQLNLDSQKDSFDPFDYVEKNNLQDKVKIVWGDVSVEVFEPSTIEMINRASPDSIENISTMLQNPYGPEDLKKLFDDILFKRNDHLFSVMQKEEKEVEVVIVPWGALHMEGLEQMLLKAGYQKKSEEFARTIFHLSDVLKK